MCDLDLTSSNLITCCRVNIKFLSEHISHLGIKDEDTCTSQNWIYPSVTLFDATTNYLHDLSSLYLNQRMLILLAQLSK